jgi:hypothetical protein
MGPRRRPGSLLAALFCTVIVLHGLLLQRPIYAQPLQASSEKRGSAAKNFQDDVLAKIGIPFGVISKDNHYHSLALAKRATTPITEEQWKVIMTAGEGFFCILRASIEGAEKLGVQQSTFTNLASLGAYGWETKKLTASGANSIPVFKELDQPVLSYDPKEWFIYEVKHSRNWATDGKQGLVCAPGYFVIQGMTNKMAMKASNGYYTTQFNNDAITPTMIATFMYSPKWVKRNNPLTVYPDLQQWSDVVFLKYLIICFLKKNPSCLILNNLRSYYNAIQREGLYFTADIDPDGSSQIPPPRWFIIKDVRENDKTLTISIFKYLLQKQGKDVEDWPGHTFDVESDEDAKAILASGHGKAICWFLIQHKKQLGVNDVESVRVWKEGENVQLAFKLASVPEPPVK